MSDTDRQLGPRPGDENPFHDVPDPLAAKLGCRQMGTSTSRRGMGFVALVAMAVGWVAVRGALVLGEIAWTSTRLPRWDEAKYGVSGLRLANALADLDVVRFLTEIHALSVWPPTWPLAQVLPFWAAGSGIAVPRLLAAATWGLIAIATWWTGRAVVSRHGDAVGVVAASIFLVAPGYRVLATLGMLELPGLLLLVLVLGCYARAVTGGDLAWWRATWVGTSLLFFCKYNYGLMWLGPLLVVEVVRRCGSWRAAVLWAWRRAAAIEWRAPWPVFVALVLGVVAVVRGVGGVDTEIGGVQVRMSSAGNPLYGLYLLSLLRLAWHWRRQGVAWQRRWADLESALRAFGVWFLAPVAVWMILPPHVKDFVGFVENRSTDLSWVEAIGFYPRVLITSFSPNPVVGWSVLLLAGLGAWRALASDARGRLLAVLLATSALALVGHPYKLPRFAVSLAWLVGLMAAVEIVHWVGAKGGTRVVGSLAAISLGLAAVVGVDSRAVRAEHRAWTVTPEVAPVLDRLCDPALRRRGLLVLGTWNDLSPWLIEWWALDQRPVENEMLPLPATGFGVARRRAWALRRALDDLDSGFQVVVLIDRVAPDRVASDRVASDRVDGSVEATDQRFRAEVAWLDQERQLLLQAPWQRQRVESFDAAGYQVLIADRGNL